MKRNIELLAPGGDIDSIKAAILAGADAVYCGLDRFNARNRAANISFEDLPGIIKLAHKNDCQVFLTLNIIILENEIPSIVKLLNKLVNTKIDGIIIQDLGLFYLLSKYFKSLKIHASTQMTTHNEGQLQFLKKLHATRVNLSRELNIHEIKDLTSVAHRNNIETEVFVHGSYCISFSGICYMSSVINGNSGNRGRCSQPCRDRYKTTEAVKNYPLNLKDNSAYFDLKEIAEAGVDSIKIEGRIKKYEYVYTVVDAYRKQLQHISDHSRINDDNSDLYKVFNRDFSNAYLKGELREDMFIDDSRDFSIEHLSEINNFTTDDEKEEAHLAFYREKDEKKSEIENKLNQLSISKIPLEINISGEEGTPLKVGVKSPARFFEVASESKLSNSGKEALDRKMIMKRFKTIDKTEYYIEHLDLDNLIGDVYIPFKALTSIKKRILFILNGSKEIIKPVEVPSLERKKKPKIKPLLSILISSTDDIELCQQTDATIYFQLPNTFKEKLTEFNEIFTKNKKLIPWFPSVLIGEDYQAAVEFLHQLSPKTIVTDNSGIAHEAYELGIQWIAGLSLNIVNSYGLKCLKEYFNCAGAFISNELNKEQIQNIKSPDDFKLFYSIYQPINLMTTRQCLFFQVTGCEKNKIDNTCIQNCEKFSSITNLKNNTFYIEKSKGNYHRVYNQSNFLNTEIVTDIPNMFSSFFIDLRVVKTDTKLKEDNSEIINLFADLLSGNSNSEKKLKQVIHPITKTQYTNGI